MGPSAGLDSCGKLSLQPGFDLRTFQLKARRYTDCDISIFYVKHFIQSLEKQQVAKPQSDFRTLIWKRKFYCRVQNSPPLIAFKNAAQIFFLHFSYISSEFYIVIYVVSPN